MWGAVNTASPSSLPRFSTRGVTKSSVVSQHPTSDFVEAHYERVQLLGKGAFGSVYLIRDRHNSSLRVSKEVDAADKAPGVRDLTRQEIEFLADLDHPNIIKLYEFCEDLERNRFTLILEYISGGDCRQLLDKSPQGLSENLLGQLLYQALLALGYCHRYGVIHRDVKPDNLMLSYTGLWGDPVVTLVDFGLSAKQQKEQELYGTAVFLAPEIIDRKAYSAKSDMWALGVTAIKLLTNQMPFGKLGHYNGEIEALFKKITNYKTLSDLEPQLGFLPKWKHRSPELIRFFIRTLHVTPEQRLHANQALEEPWLQLHKAAPAGLTSQMLRSLADYSDAPPPVRCCLLAIAVRANIPDRERLGSAFLATDVDGDGRISLDDLATAVESARYWWDPNVDVSSLIRSANLDHSGGLSLTEFVAACLYAGHSSIDRLIDEAFTALDSDRDGSVSVEQIRNMFRERDAEMLQQLPQDRPFSRAEWCRCIGASCPEMGHTEDLLAGVSAVALCTNAPRTASLEGGEYVITQNRASTHDRLSIDSEEGICDDILGSDGTGSFGLLAMLQRLWPFR